MELENGKYFVGSIKGENNNFLGPMSGFKLETLRCLSNDKWVKNNKPKRMIYYCYGDEKYDDSIFTTLFMKRFGIDNVRGGAFKSKLTKRQKEWLTIIIERLTPSSTPNDLISIYKDTLKNLVKSAIV